MGKFGFNSTNFMLISYKNFIIPISIIFLIILAIIIFLINRTKIGGFQKIILIIAFVVLFFTLIIISYSLQHSNRNTGWPPIVPKCPDYWSSDTSGNNVICTNVKDLGTCPPQQGNKHLIMNFNNAPFVGANGNCAKYTWANNCGVAWDGVNYGVANPCSK